MNIEELEARQAEIRDRLQNIDAEHSGEALPEDLRAEWNSLNEEFDSNTERLTELRARRDRVEALAESEGNREEGAHFHTARSGRTTGEDIYDLSTIRTSVGDPGAAAGELRDRALRSLEGSTFPHEQADADAVRTHIERQMEVARGPEGAVAQHLLATGSPTYRRAFGRAISQAPLSSQEQGLLSRAMSLTGNAGGYAVPYQLDPTLIPTSNHSVNPYRAISRVETITTNEWRGVAVDEVEAHYRGEGVEVEDDSPELSQPTINPERVDSFIPFSIEIGQDWTGFQAEMARLFQEAKDNVEAVKFTVGAGHGSKEPQGILVGADETVETEAPNTFSSEDVYKVEEELPPRFRPMARWVANRSIYNKVRQFDTGGGADLWMRIGQGLANQVPTPGNVGAELIGYPAHEASAFDSAVEAGNLIAVLGDFRYYVIVDRIGMSVEVVQHLFGTDRRPTGQRGLLAIWRNSAEVISANAFRVLEVQAS